jgi:hypothetical protein
MAGPQIVAPAYGAGSLAEVLPSALEAVGAAGWTNSLDLPPARSYVVFLVDGLGWNLLRRHAAEAPYLSALAQRGRPITCGVPSTTASSLTSVGTGLPPGQHGVVGFTSRIPGTSRLLDALRWDSRVDPLEWQPNPTIFETAVQQGLPMTVVSRRAFERTGLTIAGQRGPRFLGADAVGERISATVDSASVDGSVTYLYDGELDSTGHRNGCHSQSWRWQLEAVDHFTETLRAHLPVDTGLVVIADHGMVDIALADRLDVDESPDLLRGVDIFGGEARMRHLYCGSGDEANVASAWRDRLGADALVLTRDEAIGSGWFGDVAPHVRPRIGDVLVASIGASAVVSSQRFPREARLIGLHGSLTADEMLVPLLVDVGD